MDSWLSGFSLEMTIWRNLQGLHDNMWHEVAKVVPVHEFLKYLAVGVVFEAESPSFRGILTVTNANHHDCEEYAEISCKYSENTELLTPKHALSHLETPSIIHVSVSTLLLKVILYSAILYCTIEYTMLDYTLLY